MANIAAQVIMGGPMAAAGAAGTLGLCAAATAALYAFRKKIPHPTEFSYIGCCFLRGGCHEHPPLTICIEIHQAKNVPRGGQVYAFVEAGRFDCSSDSAPVSKQGTVDLFERLNLHVRQKDPDVSISLWQKGLVGSVSLGEAKMNMRRDIIGEDWPQDLWVTLEKDSRASSQILVSFHLIDDSAATSTASPLLQYAMIRQTRLTGAAVSQAEFDAMPPDEQLTFLAAVIEGPLKVIIPLNGADLYFAARQAINKKWMWGAWKSKEAFERAEAPIRSIPMTAITKVVSDKHSRTQFVVCYKTRDMSETLVIERKDRDRDVWSDGLYEFITRVRAEIATQEQRREGGWKKKGEGLGLKRRKRPASSHGEGSQMPNAFNAMLQEIQGGYVSGSESSVTPHTEEEGDTPL